MKITVIGATGMVGSRIVAEAANRGHDILAASRRPNSTSTGPTAAIHPRVQALPVDVRIASELDTALVGADAAVLTVRADRDHPRAGAAARRRRGWSAAVPD